MLIPNLLLIYVEDPLKSADFYEKIFELEPTAKFPSYVAFTFENGFTFSLWSLTAKNFLSSGTGHRFELSFMVEDENKIREIYKSWCDLEVNIEQDLHEAVFGLTFVALDLDGHRIRVCMPDKV